MRPHVPLKAIDRMRLSEEDNAPGADFEAQLLNSRQAARYARRKLEPARPPEVQEGAAGGQDLAGRARGIEERGHPRRRPDPARRQRTGAAGRRTHRHQRLARRLHAHLARIPRLLRKPARLCRADRRAKAHLPDAGRSHPSVPVRGRRSGRSRPGSCGRAATRSRARRAIFSKASAARPGVSSVAPGSSSTPQIRTSSSPATSWSRRSPTLPGRRFSWPRRAWWSMSAP